MKKFVKISLIVTIAIMLLGIVLFTIGYAFGGRKEIAQMEENGELSYLNNHVHLSVGWLNNHFGLGFTNEDGTDLVLGMGDLEDSDAPEAPGKPGKSFVGSTEASLKAEEVKKLDIELGGGELILKTGDVDMIQINAETEDDFECYVKDKTLYIKGFDLKKKVWDWTDWDNRGKNKVTIIVPKTLGFKDSEIECGAGNIEITDVTLGKTGISIGAGSMECNRVTMEKACVEVGAGAVYMKDIVADKTEVSVAMGEAVLSGDFLDDVDVECAMGSLDVNIKGKETDYNYDIEAAMGSVEVAGVSYDGLAAERNIDNHAGKTIHVEASMGDIKVSFAE